MTDQPDTPRSLDVPPEIVALASSTLDGLAGRAWGPAPEGSSVLVRRVHELRSVPIGRLQVEDLRLLISQQVSIDVLVPVALGMLRYVPLLEGDYYPGDLLVAVLRTPQGHWDAHPEQAAVLHEALARLGPADPGSPVETDLDDLATRFRAGNPG